MAGVLMIGAVSYPFLPVAPLPQVDFPTIQVTTQLPGASPETIASSVTAPLERQFAQIAGVTQMTSSSTLSNSSITVQFDLNRNIDAAAQDVLTAINAAGGQLPKTLPHRQLTERLIRPTPPFSSSRSIRTLCPLRSPTTMRKMYGPEHQPDPGRRPSQRQRSAEARRTHPA
jgi:multidrug efflux pump subunit AcrB